jgi:hypothetical protein
MEACQSLIQCRRPRRLDQRGDLAPALHRKAEIDKLLPLDAAPAKRAADATQATPIAEASDSGLPLAPNAASTDASHASEGMPVASLDFEDNCQRGQSACWRLIAAPSRTKLSFLFRADESPCDPLASLSAAADSCGAARREAHALGVLKGPAIGR